MNSENLKNRLIKFTLETVELCKKLPKSVENQIFSKQIIRSSSSIGANYAEAIYSHSRIEFIHALNISRKETNETLYWLELIKHTNPKYKTQIDNLIGECTSILKILISSVKTAKLNNAK